METLWVMSEICQDIKLRNEKLAKHSVITVMSKVVSCLNLEPGCLIFQFAFSHQSERLIMVVENTKTMCVFTTPSGWKNRHKV